MIYIFIFWADNYTKLCTIDADLSRVPLLPKSKASGSGSFYRLDYDIVLLFGMTELKAQVAWKENVSLVIQFYLIVLYFVQSNRFLSRGFFRELRNGKFFFFLKKKRNMVSYNIIYILQECNEDCL